MRTRRLPPHLRSSSRARRRAVGGCGDDGARFCRSLPHSTSTTRPTLSKAIRGYKSRARPATMTSTMPAATALLYHSGRASTRCSPLDYISCDISSTRASAQCLYELDVSEIPLKCTTLLQSSALGISGQWTFRSPRHVETTFVGRRSDKLPSLAAAFSRVAVAVRRKSSIRPECRNTRGVASSLLYFALINHRFRTTYNRLKQKQSN